MKIFVLTIVFFIFLFRTMSPLVAQDDLQLERFLLRPSISIDSVSNSDDTTALYINPAGLSLHPIQAGYFYGRNIDKGIEDHTIFLNLFGASFSTQWRFAPNGQKIRRYTVGTGLGSTELLSLGFAFSWFDSTDSDLDAYQSFDLGLLFRPHRSLSFGLVGKNLTEVKIKNSNLRHRWNIGLSLRPLIYFPLNRYYDKLTLSCETTWVAGENIRTLIPRYLIEFLPINGFTFYTGIDYQENFFMGIRFSENLYQLSLQGNIPGISEKISEVLPSNPSSQGNSFNVGLLIGQENFKNRFEALNYLLEISLDNIATNETLQASLPFQAEQFTFYDVLRSIKIAQTDPQINGVLIKGRRFSGGWGQAEELRNALLKFKNESSKPIIAFMEEMHNKEYYISNVADEISMPPSGNLLLNGLKAELVFVKDLLDKIGVKADFIQIGNYKTAPDMFKKKLPSAQSKEQTMQILEDISLELKESILSSRGDRFNFSTINKIINHGLYSADEAKAVGLIDKKEYLDDLLNRFKQENDFTFFLSKDIRDYAKISFYSDSWGTKPKIAVVVIEGILLNQEYKGAILKSQMNYSKEIIELIRKLRTNSTIKGIIIRIDSPGGSALASDLIWKEISLAKEAGKFIIISFGDIAASGGYYVSMGGDQIFTNKNSITGSIGVFSGKFSLKKFYNMLGVQKTVYTTSKKAAIFSEVDEFTTSERLLLKENLKKFYKLFLERVNKNRKKLNLEQVKKNSEGRVYTGKEALKRKMVDQIGGLQVAIEIMKRKLKIDHDYVNIELYPKRKAGLLQTLLSTDKLVLPYFVKKSIQLFRHSDQLAEDRIHFLLPYQIEIE